MQKNYLKFNMILYINTSLKNRIQILIKQNNKILIQKDIIAKYKQVEKLLILIDKILNINNISLKSIKKIIVKNKGDYAGFTALRIGIATANALGYALGIKVESDDNNKLVGLLTYKDITKAKDRPNACKDEKGRLRVAAAVGVTSDTMTRIEALVNADVDAIVIDTAHGHSKGVIDILKIAKAKFSDIDYIVGNIGTPEAALNLVKAGADAVKVGIGPGSICTTRVIAGVGVPQLTAVYNVAKALKGTGVPVIADGGLRYSGDIVKAIAAGANSVMAGSLFAGVDESPGETIIFQGRKFKTYRGMGSIEAMQQGSKDRYFQDYEDDVKKLVPEGIAARVPYKGNLSEIVYQLIGGLRAGMGYCGAANIEDLKKAKFVKVSPSGVIESHPHDVTITREAPNYSSFN